MDSWDAVRGSELGGSLGPGRSGSAAEGGSEVSSMFVGDWTGESPPVSAAREEAAASSLVLGGRGRP